MATGSQALAENGIWRFPAARWRRPLVQIEDYREWGHGVSVWLLFTLFHFTFGRTGVPLPRPKPVIPALASYSVRWSAQDDANGEGGTISFETVDRLPEVGDPVDFPHLKAAGHDWQFRVSLVEPDYGFDHHGPACVHAGLVRR